jgi:hypothetical protein
MTERNIAVIVGRLSELPEVRVTAKGRRYATFEVRAGDSAVPVSWLEPQTEIERWAEEEALVVIGEVRKRFSRSGSVTRSRTDIVASDVMRASQRKRAAAALELVAEQLVS